MRFKASSILVVLLLVALSSPAAAQTIVVSNTNDSGPGSLRAAIAEVNAGNATVIDMTGLSGTLTLDSSLPSIINEAAIIGAGPGLTIVGVAGNEVSLGSDATVTLANFVIGDAFTKTGSGTLEWSGSDQSYTEATYVSNGTLRTMTSNLLSASSSTGVAFGATLDLDGTSQSVGALFIDMEGLVDLGAGSLTITGGSPDPSNVLGTLAGDGGSLHITGTAQMTFGLLPATGFGTYTGSTTVSGDGFLGLLNDQTLSTETTLIINDNATIELEGTHTYSGLSGNGGTLFMCECVSLTIDQDFDSTFAGEITDDGFLGGATFIKAGSGRLMLSGVTSHIGGTEVLGGTLAGTTDSLRGDIVNDATLEFDQDFTGEFDGYISGTGQLVKSGSGLVEFFTGNNDYTGGTVMNAGTLVTFGDYSLGRGALTMNGGTVHVFSEEEVTSLSGAGGDLRVWNFVTVDQDVDTIYAGGLSGSGAIEKFGQGTLTMSGAKDFLGAIGVYEGRLALGGTTSVLSNADGVAIFEDGQLELRSNQTLHDVLVAGRLDVGSHTLTLDTQSGSLFFGNVTGNGRIIVDGVGMLALGQSDFSGNLTLTGSSLSAFVGDNVFPNASLTINDDAIVDMEGLQQIRGLSGNGGELFLCFCAALVVDQNFDTAFRGRLAGDAGSVFVKSGSGRLMLAGNSSDFFGAMGVVEGVLAGTTSSLVGDIANFATLEFAQDTDGEFSNEIFGTGALVKSGAGALRLTGNNTYSGGTTIAEGTLLVESDANLGAATGGLTFDGGTLGILTNFGSNRDVTLAGAGTIDTDIFSAVLTGDISGSGSLTKTGDGLLYLAGTSSYTGGTRVLGGILAGNTDSLRGSIANDGLIFFDQAFDDTFGGTISGSGAVIKFGTGTLTFDTPQTYLGPTLIRQGTLQLNSALAGTVIVENGTLSFGDTFIPSFPSSVHTGAATAAALGAGAGPADIGGDLFMSSASTYRTTVAGDGTVTTLDVGGAVAIDGATLQLDVAAGTGTARRATSTLIQAGSISGGFGSVTGLDGAFDPYLFSSSNNIGLLLVQSGLDFSAFGDTLNGSAAGGALVAAQSAGGGSDDLRFVTRELAALATDAELATALDRISGSAHASFAGISMIASADAIDVLTTRLAGRGGWWLQGMGSNLSLKADVDPGVSSASMQGALVGYDRRTRAGAMYGVAAGFTDNDIDASGGLDRLDGRAYRGAAYMQITPGRVVIDGIVSAASHRVRGSRGIRFAATLEPEFGGGLLFGGVDRTASFDYDAFEIAAVADAGYRIQAGGFTVQPSLGAQFTRISRGAFEETGADALDLSAGEDTVSSTAGRVRLSVERRYTRASGRWFAPRASVRYTRELGDREVPLSAALAGASFTASGFALPASLFSARAGVAAGFGALTLSLDYRAAVAAGHRHHLVSAGFGF